MGHIQRLFGPQGLVPRALCVWMCRPRAIVQWIAVAAEPL